MKTFLLIALIVLSTLIIGFIAFGRENVWDRLAGPVDTGPINLKGHKRTGNPNDALICSTGYCPADLEADAQLPLLSSTPAEIVQQIEQKLRDSGIRHKRVDDRSDSTRLRFITWSPLMRYPDLNEFVFVPAEQGKTAIIGYARAQVGLSDLGANLNRLKMLTAELQ